MKEYKIQDPSDVNTVECWGAKYKDKFDLIC